MERSLEVTDNSTKLEDENASSYSASFQLDNLPPSKKGTRESVALHVKVKKQAFRLSHVDATFPKSWSYPAGVILDAWPPPLMDFLDVAGYLSMSARYHHVILFLYFRLQLNGGYEFTTSLQIKIYKANSTQHCDWGTTVHSIEYECHTDQQNNSIKIIKDTFR